jgi:hypothetical protein
MTTIWVALVAAVASLGGVVMGSVLEPIKLAAARRARARELLMERCTSLVEAAVKSRSRSLQINRLHRKLNGGEEIEADDLRTAEKDYWQARDDIIRLATVFQLSGPRDLADLSHHVRNADYGVRENHQAPDRTGPRSIGDAVDALDDSIKSFMESARRHMQR